MKKTIAVTLLLIIFLFTFILMRSSFVSENLKAIILPEIEYVINKKVSADKIYLNIFPLFVGINELKAFDDDNKEIFHTKKVRGYIGFFELFNKKIMVKRLSIKEPVISMQKKQLEDIISSIPKLNTTDKKKPITLIIKSVHIDNANIAIWDNNYTLSMSGFNSYILTLGRPEIKISGDKISFSKKDVLNLDGRMALHIILENNILDIKSLHFTLNNNSNLKTSGFFNIKKFSGELGTELNLLVDSLKKMFGLVNRGEGFLSVKGSIKAVDLKSDLKNIFLNLKVKGDIYLETLMELLKVKETLQGKLTFNGTLKGRLDDVVGNASAELQKGNLFGVEIDKLNCQVDYSEGKMRFTNGVASLYGGSADAEAVINLPVVNYYAFNVKAHDVSSKKLFELIKWDPNLPEGKVSGEISSSGSVFNPDINFIYKNVDYGKDILGRIGEIKGILSMRDNLINFSHLVFSNPKSSLAATGTVDLKNSKLNFTGKGKTLDLKDITSPYFTAVSGSGEYNLLLSGKFDNPLIDLNFTSEGLSLATANLAATDVFNNKVFNFSSVRTTLTYEKNILILKNFYAKHQQDEFSARGKIFFKKATKLFEIKEPDYDLKLTGKNFDIGIISQTIKGLPEMNGLLSTDFYMKGQPNSLSFSGEFNAKGFSYREHYLADNLVGNFSYAKRQFLIGPASLKKGDSLLSFNGSISLDKKYHLNAKGNQIKIVDIFSEFLKEEHKTDILREMYLDNLTISGEGSLDNPRLEIKAFLHGKKNRVGWLSKGSVNLKIAEKKADLNLSIMDNRLTLIGNASLTGIMPWSADLVLKPANYAPLLSGFIKEAPDDLLLNLTGNVKAYGDKNNINANIVLNRTYLHLYGVGLANSSDILVNINNKAISIGSFVMQGDDTELSLSGGISIGKNYDLQIDGTASIAPIKVLFKEVETLRGKAYFSGSLTGLWDKPKIDGGIDLTNGTLAMKNIPYRMTSISAYLYVDENKIIVKNINSKLAGGDVFAFGTIYLQGLEIKNFFIESRLKDLTLSPSKDLLANLDGVLYYRGNMKSQELSGDIDIKRAKYTERVEWKSWLLQVRKREAPKLDVSRFGQTAINIRVKGDSLIINNNIADTTAKMDIILRGIVSKPVLLGKVYTDKGIVYFRNNEFRVLKARVDFIDPEKTTPHFDITADTKVKNYLIKLHLDGNFERFDLTLSSDPHLNEGDIFSLLTVGNIGRQMKGLEGGIGAGEASLFLAGKLQDVLEERIRTITGLDRIQIDPQVSKITGTITPRLTASKKIMGDKLLVTYSTSAGTGEEQIWRLEYLLDKNTSFVFIRDERAAIGGDIKFRFEFK